MASVPQTLIFEQTRAFANVEAVGHHVIKV